MAAHSVHYNSIVWQGVIQDFEVEGGNKKSAWPENFEEKKVNCFNTLIICKIASYGHSVIQLVTNFRGGGWG